MCPTEKKCPCLRSHNFFIFSLPYKHIVRQALNIDFFTEEILGVLKWNTHYAEGTLRNALTQLLSVPSEELVKFLQDILDALFSILTQVINTVIYPCILKINFKK